MGGLVLVKKSVDIELMSGSEAGFLATLFSTLAEARVRYAVMRNYETLPDNAGGSDLDIIVDREDGSRAKMAVLAAIHTAGGVPIGLAESIGFFKVCAIGRTVDPVTRWWGQCVDINVGLLFRGYPLLAANIPWPMRLHNGIPVLCEGFAGTLGVLKEVLNNQRIPVRYAPSARRAAEDEWPQLERLFAPLGRTALAALRALLLSDTPVDERRGECKKVRRSLLVHALFQRPIVYCWHRICYEVTKVRRFVKPPGLVVAILGVDGAGKSTVISAILPILNAATHNAVVVQHLRPGLLSPLARLKGKGRAPGAPVLDPHSSTPSGTVGSLFRVTYLIFDYLLGYWLRTRPRIAKQPTVVLFDRYAYDMRLDPRRFRIGLAERTLAWFVQIAPKPDLIFCLYGSPEVIAERKKELSVEETRRQVAALLALASSEPRSVLISTDVCVEETRNRVLSALCDYLRRQMGCGT